MDTIRCNGSRLSEWWSDGSASSGFWTYDGPAPAAVAAHRGHLAADARLVVRAAAGRDEHRLARPVGADPLGALEQPPSRPRHRVRLADVPRRRDAGHDLARADTARGGRARLVRARRRARDRWWPGGVGRRGAARAAALCGCLRGHALERRARDGGAAGTQCSAAVRLAL